ncbi:myotilin isoform X2 [Callorhinchus milii]|uniref:myotilin isoform X2 n=1 Tax=Callorhinchus milii TaxID=7868 RepID=UPI001C3FAB33|nr:myotilin isoform X2 [Callorhinchus milii]
MYSRNYHATTQSSPCITLSGTSAGIAPVFSKSLQDVTSPTSQLVVLECRIQGAPPLSVQWYRQETLIKDSADFRILRKKACLTVLPEDVCTLVITEAFPEDSGVYKCVATNQNGTSSCSGQLTVYSENQDTQKSEAFYPGRYSDLPPPANGKGRDSGIKPTTNANVQHASENSKQMTHQQVRVCPVNAIASPSQRTEVSNNPSFDLPQQNASDLNREAKANKQKQDPLPSVSHLTGSIQQVAPDQPSQSKVEPNHRTTEMNVVNLPSRPVHQSSFNYERPSHFLQSQTKRQPKYQPVSASAPFPQHSQATQARLYMVQPLPLSSQQPVNQNGQRSTSPSTLSSPASTRSSSFGSPGELSPPLTPQSSHSSQSPINPPPTQMFSPFFTQSPAAFLSSVLPSQRASLPMNHSSLPTTETYDRNPRIVGKKTVKSPKLTSDQEIQGSKDAVIQDLERKLRCKNGLLSNGQQRLTYEEKMARRLLGPENVASVFDLQQTESDASQQQNSNSQRRQDYQSQASRQRHGSRENENESIQEQLFPPRFLQKPDGNIVIQEYGFCRIDTKVGGLPSPELSWYLNGQPVCQDFTHKMLVSGKGVHSLIIDAVTSRDAGLYECVASNRAGENRFTVQLDVEAQEARRPAEFIYKLQNTKAVEGGEVRLDCLVSGSPQPNIFWRKDHEMIKCNTDRIRMIQSDEGRVGLQIFSVSRCDAGWYTVSAQNDTGTSICTARLDVHNRPIAQVPSNRQLKVQPTFNQYFNDQRPNWKVDSQHTASYPGLLESEEL